MTFPSFDPRVTLGNLLVLVTMVAGIGMWAVQRERDDQALADAMTRMGSAVEGQAVQINGHAALLARHGERISALETLSNQRQAEIIRRLERIEDKVDRR